MSTKDDELIKEMLKAFKTISSEFGDEFVAMRVVLGVARKTILEEAASHLERRANNLANEFGECPRSAVLREAEQAIRSLTLQEQP